MQKNNQNLNISLETIIKLFYFLCVYVCVCFFLCLSKTLCMIDHFNQCICQPFTNYKTNYSTGCSTEDRESTSTSQLLSVNSQGSTELSWQVPPPAAWLTCYTNLPLTSHPVPTVQDHYCCQLRSSYLSYTRRGRRGKRGRGAVTDKLCSN